jgi:hypothetical protein
MNTFIQNRSLMLTAALTLASILTIGCTKSETAAREESIERGKYLVTVMDCNGCHTPFVNGEADMTRMLSGHPWELKITKAPAPPGGPWVISVTHTNTAWAGPWGVTFTPNLTPDENTGMGIWTEQMFIDAIRKGRHMGVSREILPPMPWRMQAKLTDEDLKAIYAYLRTIPAISNRVPEPIDPVLADEGGDRVTGRRRERAEYPSR